jgi:hypothetical protein
MPGSPDVPREIVGRLSNARHEAFCQLFVFGNPEHDPEAPEWSPPNTLHNATKSYELAGYKARGNSAAVNGSRLLRRLDVQERIEELREDVVHMARTRRFRWAQLFPKAQEVLNRALAGEAITPAQIQAAKEVIQRDEGPLGYRFRDPKTGKERSGIPIFVLGTDDGDDDPGEEEAGGG